MIEIGRVCVKIAGRDAGLKCVVVDILDGVFVLIDGETRRRKCNVSHLEVLSDVLKISKGASHDVVKAAFKDLGVKIVDKKSKSVVHHKKPAVKAEAPKTVKKTVKKAPIKKAE